MHKKYFVFLDIDGVLTSSRVHVAHNAYYEMWHRFDPVAVDFFNKIHDTYNVEFVLMSTWKNYLDVDDHNIEHWVKSAFANSGFRGKFANYWKTDPHETWVNKSNYNRAHEVKEYLEEYGQDVEDFLLFDDNDYDFNKVLGKKRFVKTDPENGLLYKHMKNALSVIGQWSK